MNEMRRIEMDLGNHYSIDRITVSEPNKYMAVYFKSGNVWFVAQLLSGYQAGWGDNLIDAYLNCYRKQNDKHLSKVVNPITGHKILVHRACPALEAIELAEPLVEQKHKYIVFRGLRGIYIAIENVSFVTRFAFGSTPEIACKNLEEKIAKISTFPIWLQEFAHVVPSYVYVELLDKYYYPTL